MGGCAPGRSSSRASCSGSRPPARAQSAPTPDREADDADAPRPPVFYETTTVTARPVSSASGAVSVLDSREVAASASRSASDLLRQVPGLNALSSGSRAGVTNAFLRGGDPNYTLVLLDGIPLNDTTERQGGAVNLEELPAGLVDHVEVVRGPLTSFYGTSALAGVIQVFTPRGGPGPLQARLGAEAGNADLWRGFGGVSGPAGRGGYAAGASWDEEQYRIARDRFRQLDAFANADLPLGSTTDLALTGRFADGTIDDYPDASGGPVYGSGLVRHTEHRDLALGARLGFGDPAGRRQQVSVALSRREQDRLSPAVPPVVPESDETTTFTRLRVAWQVPVVRTARTVVDAGLSGEGEWGENASVLKLPPSLGGDVPGDYAESRASGGAYAGARHERGALLYEASLRLDLATGDVLQANPHVGVVWRPGSGATRLRASVGRASKLPSFFALASPPALGGNPALRARARRGAARRGSSTASPRRASTSAPPTSGRSTATSSISTSTASCTSTAPDVRTQGVELTARWQPHATVWLDAEATWLDVQDLESGGTLLHTPKWTGGGRLTWQPSPALSLRVQARATAGYLDVQYPVPDRDSVDGYGLLGVAGSWRFSRGLSVRARADNLTGTSYETYIGFPGPGRAFWVGLGWDR